ncbi:MAG: hypothetical protein ACFFBP_11970 [Promethearchaeota archaeon]
MTEISREKELEMLRLKIIEAIRFSTRYWMIFKEKTFGIATILDLIYKKSYIEVLFFTNYDVMELGVPLLKIYTPIETEVNLNEILLEPDFDKDGLISPVKIIKKVNQLIKKEFEHHIAVLDEEVRLLNEKYENYELNDIPYNREIIIFFPTFTLDLKINFEKYPLIPNISFSDELSKIITINEFLETEMFINWNPEYPIHVIHIIEELINIITKRLKIKNLPEDSQHLLIKKVSVGNNIKNLSFKMLRGTTIGIHYEEDQFKSNIGEISSILDFFEAIMGINSSFSGVIKVFGKNIQLALKSELDKITMISTNIDSNIKNVTVKKILSKEFDLKSDWKDFKEQMGSINKKIGINFIKGELGFKTLNRNYKKNIINQILKVSGLLDRKNDKIRDLTLIETLLFSISRAIISLPHIILLSAPNINFGRSEIEKFNKCIKKFKKDYNVSFIIHGTKDILSICDQIINITPEMTEIGSIDDYLQKLPQSGEILTIELSRPNLTAIKQMLKMDSVIFIEERRNEKYKLFIQENPEKIIIFLLELFGSKLYNFRRFRATLGEYLEFLEYKKYGRIYK